MPPGPYAWTPRVTQCLRGLPNVLSGIHSFTDRYAHARLVLAPVGDDMHAIGRVIVPRLAMDGFGHGR